MNFDESERYLFSLGNEVSAMKLGLETVRLLLDELGKPDQQYPKMQVAGTNGKGSVCAFVNAILLSAGIKTGLFTSPHLVSIRERIQINGRHIGEAEFASIATFVRETSELLVERGSLSTVPTFFEQVTAIALIAFANHGVEIAILETGLGGRLDATTAANAEYVAITQIDYDHQEYLGDTFELIAAEKAAIIHPGCKAVIAEQSPAAMGVILDRCAATGVKPLFAQAVTTGRNTSGSECADPQLTSFSTSQGTYTAHIALHGEHQIDNAKVAILIAELLNDLLPITKDNIEHGLENARHPGRLEFQGQYLFDGAHNAAGTRVLRQFLDDKIKQPITLVFAAMQGKNVIDMAGQLFPVAQSVVLTQPQNSRALSPEQIIDQLPEQIDRTNIVSTRFVEDALQTAKTLAGDDGIIVVTGSLYLVGEAKKILNN